MMSSKVMLTYKRKRLHPKLDKENGFKGDIYPNVSGMVSLRCFEQKLEVEDLNRDNAHCSTCGSVDANENLLTCGNCSESYHLSCTDPPLKYIPEEKWQCLECAKRCSFEGSVQHKPQRIRRKNIKGNTGEPDLGPMKLRSCKLLLNTNPLRKRSRKGRPSSVDSCLLKIKDTTLADDTNENSGAESKAIRHTENSVVQITNLEVSEASNPLLLNSTEEMLSPECHLDVFSSPAITDAISVLLNNDENSKENHRTPVITFSRRTKKKRCVVEASNKSDSKLVEEQSGSAFPANVELAVSCKSADSSVNLSSMERLTKSANLSSEAEHSLQHDDLQKDISDKGKDSRLEDSTSRGIYEEPYLQSLHNIHSCGLAAKDPISSQSIGCGVQGTSDEIIVLPTSGVVRDSFSLSKDENLDLANTNRTIERQENKLVEEGCSVTGDPFACLKHTQPSEQTGDATTQNPLESQSSSTVVLEDEHTGDGTNKVKAMGMSNLCEQNLCDKVRTSSSCLENNHSECKQALKGSTSYLCPINLSAESKVSQNESRECLNNNTALQEELYVIKLDEVTGGKKLREEARNPSRCTNMLGLNLTVNRKGPENSIPNCYDMPLSSWNSSAKGIPKDYNSKLLWGIPGEHTSILRRDKAYDNILIGSQILKESQRTLSNAFERFLPEWSEEELDSLWIGVRRHGLNNWNAILRDPKLYFFHSRIPKDLAEQWDREQIKLLSGSLYQTTRPTQNSSQFSGTRDVHLAMPVANDRFDQYGVRPASFQISTLKALDTRLSLGNVYSQNEHQLKNSLLQLSRDKLIVDKVPPASSSGGCTQASSANPTAGIREQASFKAKYSRSDWEASASHKKSSGRLCHDYHHPVSNVLPHWLKDALNMPPRQNSSILPSVSGIGCSFPNNNERTLTNAGRFRSEFLQPRGMLKKSTMPDNNADSVRMSDYSLLIGEVRTENGFGVHPIPGLAPLKPTVYSAGLGKRNCTANGPNDLVVIDSDASSEETISDDQGNM